MHKSDSLRVQYECGGCGQICCDDPFDVPHCDEPSEPTEETDLNIGDPVGCVCLCPHGVCGECVTTLRCVHPLACINGTCKYPSEEGGTDCPDLCRITLWASLYSGFSTNSALLRNNRIIAIAHSRGGPSVLADKCQGIGLRGYV